MLAHMIWSIFFLDARNQTLSMMTFQWHTLGQEVIKGRAVVSKPQSKGALQNPTKHLHWILQSKELWWDYVHIMKMVSLDPWEVHVNACWLVLCADTFQCFFHKTGLIISKSTSYPWELFHTTLSSYAYFLQLVSLAYVSHHSTQKSSAPYAWIPLAIFNLLFTLVNPCLMFIISKKATSLKEDWTFFLPIQLSLGIPSLVLGL